MKKGLGRGFESLIPTNLIDESFDPTAKQDDQVSQLVQLSIDKIAADPEQPRRVFDEEALAELAASIKEHGVVQPLVVTPHNGRFMIVAGERRWRASKLAGLSEVPALVRTLNGQHRLEISLIENLQRRDLNPLETATAYAKLRDQFNLTLEEIGVRVGGKSVSAISNTMRLLKLPKSVQNALFAGDITEGQARPLIGAPAEVIEAVLEKIIAEGLSVRRIEQLMSAVKTPVQEKDVPKQQLHQATAEQWAKRFQSKITVRTTAKGSGKIVIPFKDEADFERIRQLLG
ncbi:MAG: ParB/RepB/Spo0J family partition protein [Candidatus Saccharibacteria bacterium]|nr:ParB/RepB/Spo0J family partition protein [Candidatus Saccharibacteria bacterium]